MNTHGTTLWVFFFVTGGVLVTEVSSVNVLMPLEWVKAVYFEIGLRSKGNRFHLDRARQLEVDREDDLTRSKFGIMVYSELMHTRKGDRSWVLGVGIPRGSLVAHFSGDLLAVPHDGDLSMESVVASYEKHARGYFETSLFFVTLQGDIQGHVNSRYRRLGESLRGIIANEKNKVELSNQSVLRCVESLERFLFGG